MSPFLDPTYPERPEPRPSARARKIPQPRVSARSTAIPFGHLPTSISIAGTRQLQADLERVAKSKSMSVSAYCREVLGAAVRESR